MIKQAVILAAGNGSRLTGFKKETPKPLRQLGGISLIKRAILTAKKAGITDFVIVVGFEGDQIISQLSRDKSLGVGLRFIKNNDWKKSNGVSVLKARQAVDGDFLLMMADHIVEEKAVHKIAGASLWNNQLVLGVDGDLNGIFDVDDATKVQINPQGEILKIGKTLSHYDVYDTGIFACSYRFFDTLEKVYLEKGDVSLSEGVQALASQGLAGTLDLTGHFWQDVDTPESFRFAEKKLYQNLYKPTDGWISRHFNRKISIFFTRLLMKTGLSASHVTGLVSLIGILSGVFVSTGRYPGILIGGILFNLASILDGCDGEMARLKLSSSRVGEWLDTFSDNITYLAFLVGIAVGVYHQNPSPWVVVQAGLLFSGLVLTLSLMFYYLIRYTDSGSLASVQWEQGDEDRKGPQSTHSSLFSKVKFLMKRDFFAVFFMLLAAFNQLNVILLLSVVGLNLTWVVILAYKRTLFNIPEAAAKPAQFNR